MMIQGREGAACVRLTFGGQDRFFALVAVEIVRDDDVARPLRIGEQTARADD